MLGHLCGLTGVLCTFFGASFSTKWHIRGTLLFSEDDGSTTERRESTGMRLGVFIALERGESGLRDDLC